MSETEQKAPRGRPKTFDRDAVTAIAMQAYWQEGQSEVSLNEVCRRAKVSKPTLYKEFGSEDGLKQAVLSEYHSMTLAPLFELLEQDQPFDKALDALAEYILRDHHEHGMPNGCLFVDMCQCRDQLGELAGRQVDAFKVLSLTAYAAWIDRAKAKGQFTHAVASRTAAIYIEAQIASAMNLQRQGATADEVSAMFRLALSVFRPEAAIHKINSMVCFVRDL
ncbi:TetR/AcrR family transcriptional regulator [Tateyamaria sp. SN3-11]|uniref:TetR/AcrR family transcriptional regulator n=1 Tax=Tateyamaria sp. SN3-11 TaxID=3092147 RepID=UPI0039EC3A7D